MINVAQSPMTIADYCRAFQENGIIVNRDYQRSWQVWPSTARSFLIESIVLGFPVPKLSLHQVLDLRSRTTVKEIVDGQQRTAAIVEFFQGDLRLSRGLETEEIAGRTYDELDPEYQEAFLSYSLAIDLFVGATNEEIREVFRRMNSYTVPLNPEEDRHASFQGEFKWYIYKLARAVEGTLESAGVLSQRNFVRMQDAKLLTEITHALHYGIKTTNKNHLRKIYEEFDDEFPSEEEDRERLMDAFDRLGEWTELHDGPLMKSYIVYSLILAITDVQEPVDALHEFSIVGEQHEIDDEVALRGLSSLAEALDLKEEYEGPLQGFVDACIGRTNVREQRAKRFEWLERALVGTLP